MIIAAIPTMSVARAWPLVESLLGKQTQTPDEVFLFNNGDAPFDPKPSKHYDHNKIKVFNFGTNIGVNACWNHALSIAKAKFKHLLLLNDDVIVHKNFIKKTTQALNDYPSALVVCPLTTNAKRLFSEADYVGENVTSGYERMRKREGWAFTINRECLEDIPPIPKELFIFFGDDWIWLHTRRLWIKDLTNIIYHAVGATLKEKPDLRILLEKERSTWKKILASMNAEVRGSYPVYP